MSRCASNFVPMGHTRPKSHVSWLTIQLRNLVVVFFLERVAVSESGRGNPLTRTVAVGNLTPRLAI